MAISPIEFNATITRTQDFTTLKQNEDQKGVLQQSNFQTQMEKETKLQLSQVRTANNAEKKQDQTDAKEKGKGQYFGDGGKNRKKDETTSKAQGTIRSGGSSFDISI